MGTFSKAVGSFGAYVCGSQELIDFFINKARSFIYTTGLPPSVAAASCSGIDVIEQEPSHREQLWANTRYVLDRVKALGFDTLETQTPIIPLVVKQSASTVLLSKRLYEQGIFVAAIRPPTVPQDTARLRLTIMATHTQQDLDKLLSALAEVKGEL